MLKHTALAQIARGGFDSFFEKKKEFAFSKKEKKEEEKKEKVPNLQYEISVYMS